MCHAQHLAVSVNQSINQSINDFIGIAAYMLD